MDCNEKHGGLPERAYTQREPVTVIQPPDNDDRPAFVPRIEKRDVYYEMIASELRNGRLTRARRKRIIQYAAHLGLNAVEAGRLITQCGELALQSDDPVERDHALKLVEPEPERVPIAFKIAIVVALALVVDLVVLGWAR